MKKHLKYLISLFLVFSLMANEGFLYSQSNSVDYYQYSNVILRRELNYKSLKLYVFNQTLVQTTPFSILIAFLKLKDVYSLQTSELLKLRTLLYQKVSSLIAHSIFVNEIITSKNFYKNLYIA